MRSRVALQPGKEGRADPVRRPFRKWRNKRMAARLRKPVQRAGHMAGAPPARAASSRRPGTLRVILTVGFVTALLFGVPVGLYKLLHSSSPTAAGGHPSGGPSASASSVQTPLFTTTNAFAGSPAASFAGGAAGIVLPVPRGVGTFSTFQVGRAFETVKKLLITANLDWPTLRGQTPTAFGSLLVRQQRTWFYDHLAKPLSLKNRPHFVTRSMVTSFARGTEFVGSVIKVHGDPMTASVATVNGRPALQISVNYVFVYAVEQQGNPGSRIRVVAHERAVVQFAQWDDPGGMLEPWVSDFGDGYANAQCGTTDGYVHPAFPQVGPGAVKPSGQPVDPYNLATPQSTQACQPITRS
jgi:hypothetical protein